MKTKNSIFPSNYGFSLIELCIVMVIIGFLFSTFASYSKILLSNKWRSKTNDHIEQTHEAIATYLDWYKHLPCPASLTASPEDEEYGQKLDCESIARFSNFGQKEYIIGKVKRENEDKQREVIIGRIPFKELGLNLARSKDAWNNDIFYAVSADLTNTNDYSQSGGVIDVIDEFDHTLITQEAGVQYVLWSSGQDNKNIINTDCERNDEAFDAENCDNDGTFRSMGYSEGEQPYDDILSYKITVYKPDVVDDVCDLISHLSDTVTNLESIIDQENLRRESFYIQPGEQVFVCNDKILRQLNENTCALFMCRWDYTISHIETIK